MKPNNSTQTGTTEGDNKNDEQNDQKPNTTGGHQEEHRYDSEDRSSVSGAPQGRDKANTQQKM